MTLRRPTNLRTQKIPSLKTGVDIYSLPLSSADGFILACIDGIVTVEDISTISGIEQESINKTIQRLDELGALTWSDGKKATPSPEPLHGPDPLKLKSDQAIPSPPTSVPADKRRTTGVGSEPTRADPDAARGKKPLAAVEKPAGQSGQVPIARTSQERVVNDQQVDLPPDKCKLIDGAYLNLERQTLYQSLGLPQNATRDEIRNAYFNLSKVFHPDSAYGQRLGGYKAKMEAVFKRLTEAYDVLGKKPRRQEYDEYLAAAVHTAEAQEALERGVREAEVIGQAVLGEPNVSAAPPAPQATTSLQCLSPPSETTERTSAPEIRASAPPGGVARSMPPSTPEERRLRTQQLLRRRMSGVTARPPASSRSTTITNRPDIVRSIKPPESDRESALRREQVLRGLATSLKGAAMASRTQRANQQLLYAKEFEQKGNLIEAANCLRLAATFEPEREDIKNEYQRVTTLVSADLASRYEKRAQYEERAGQWKVAADSWGKVSDGRPKEALPARKSAEMFLKAGENFISAKKYAERAVELDPRNISNLTVLARVYIVCGQAGDARRELEKAVKLDPGNEVVKNLIRDLS